jgi:hypothetical protein
MPINPSESVFVSAQVIRTIATPGAAAAAHSMSTVGSLEQELCEFHLADLEFRIDNRQILDHNPRKVDFSDSLGQTKGLSSDRN